MTPSRSTSSSSPSTSTPEKLRSARLVLLEIVAWCKNVTLTETRTGTRPDLRHFFTCICSFHLYQIGPCIGSGPVLAPIYGLFTQNMLSCGNFQTANYAVPVPVPILWRFIGPGPVPVPVQLKLCVVKPSM